MRVRNTAGVVRSPPSETHAHTVLLVDDVDDIREAMAYILRTAGFIVATASGGEDAVRQLRKGYGPA